MILSLRIAYKFHKSFKKNKLISLVSFIAILSITVGIVVSIVSLSIINGFQYELKKRVLSVIPHGEIISINVPFTNWKKMLIYIKQIPGIIYAEPYINIAGVIEYHNKCNLIHMRSVNLANPINVSINGIINFIDVDSWNFFCTHEDQIILGKGVSDSLNIKTRDWVTIIFSNSFKSENKFLFKKICMQVSGIIDLNSQLDENIAIISLSNAHNYSGNRLDVDGISIYVDNVFCINKIIEKINHKFQKNVKVCSWTDLYGYIYRDIQIVRVIIYVAVFLIIGMSCFNIIAVLILSIKNKYKDISVLKILGARNILIQYIFLWYNFIIYCVSSILGSGLGILISSILTNVDMKSFSIFGNKILPKGMYFIDFVPIYLNKSDVYLILIVVFLMGTLISWYLSLRIKKINLAQILK